MRTLMVSWQKIILGSCLLVPGVLAVPVEEPEVMSWEDFYGAGKALFDEYAPPEIKEEYEFPSEEEWNTLASHLQEALADESLAGLAQQAPEAEAALDVLKALPGSEDYLDWLEERIDYIEAAKEMTAIPETRQTGPEEPVLPSQVDIPHLELWRGRMQSRAEPGRAGALMPMLRAAFATEGVPEELAWMAEAESSFNPEARSPVGARGLFQFMPATAKEMGLSTVLPDERTDPEKSAKAAAQYLRRLHARFGTWPLALAAYNAGGGRVRSVMKKANATTFAEISPSLPSETRMYVPKVLATLEARTGRTWEQVLAPKS